MNRHFLKNLYNKPLFWIVLFLFIRLYGITNPPLEVGHNWRQATGLMVARNFYEVDNNILYPRIDITSGKSGIIGMEFPILNYLHYLMALLFGYEHWYGRLINLIITSLGIYCFSKFIKEKISSKVSLYSTIILLSSIWFAFSRKMMPDTFSVSLTFIGIYYGSKYLENNKWQHLLLSFLLFTLGALSKIPAVIYFATISTFAVSNKRKSIQFIKLSILSIVSLLIVYLWYFQWNPFLEKSYGNWYNLGNSFSNGLYEIVNNKSAVFKNFYFNTFQSYILFPVSILGLYLLIKLKKRDILLPSFSVLLVFVAYMIKSGFYFHHHNYYIIPIVPIFSVFAAYALSRIKLKQLAIALLTIGVVESVLNQSHDFRIKESNLYKLTLTEIMDKVSKKGDLIAINSGGNPQQLYLSHRKGFVFENMELEKEEFLSKLYKQNCKYIVIDKHLSNYQIDSKIVFEDEHYKIYALYSE